jgi:bifunctional UDP-N-acetylglucosamine pyrophosphorylase/glucosamine-1-phosphate N-acetyltransferase
MLHAALTGLLISYNVVFITILVMENLAVIILAAGKGKRMRSGLVKVLHPLLGRQMLAFPLECCLNGLHPKKTVVVIGHQAEQIRAAFPDPQITFVEQKEQLGTGHAVAMTEPLLKDFPGTILILSGDTPLIRAQTLSDMVKHHRSQKATLTILTAYRADPTGYGRVLRGKGAAGNGVTGKGAAGKAQRVVEEKDALPRQRGIKEVNTGIYCVEAPFLFQAISALRADNAQGEYYLPDIIEAVQRKKKKVATFTAPDAVEVMGINTRAELVQAEDIVADRLRRHWMAEGVTIHDPGSVYIEPSVRIGRDTVIRPNCYLRGETVIGEGCTIGPQVEIVDSQVGDRVEIRFCTMITASRIADEAIVGPFAHLRPQSQLEKGAKIGNFVEVKKSRIGPGTKANHLAYIGDSEVGAGVNIGAGTITCNYDGYQKHRTIIEDGAFVGSNTALVAPVKIGKGASVGAGTTVTKDVPPHALAISRTRQKSIKDWVIKKEKNKERQE